ncbi:MAG: M23 family metallopeptidase [Nostocoides sp.]
MASRQVIRRFDRPANQWAAGHRGLDLAARAADPVTAVEDGVVTYAGVVAGVGVVAVTHADGLRSTFQPVKATVIVGERVRAGQVIGAVLLSGSHCAPAVCLHLGAVRGSHYLDPWPLLVRSPIVLLPVDPES